jgi:hypothetical protein
MRNVGNIKLWNRVCLAPCDYSQFEVKRRIRIDPDKLNVRGFSCQIDLFRRETQTEVLSDVSRNRISDLMNVQLANRKIHNTFGSSLILNTIDFRVIIKIN